MMVVSLLLVLGFSIGVSASSCYDRQEADACITISERLSVKGGSETLKVSNSKMKHVHTGHNPNKVAEQLKYTTNIPKKTYFNKNWSNADIEKAVNYGYNQAVNKGVVDGIITLIYNNEEITICMEKGIFKTAYGNCNYSIKDLLELLGDD